ncbi:MAG: NADH-quinone oxidoreductase subunit N [Flavobacteriales bacterium]
MDALIIIFVTGLLGLFVGMLKKTELTLFVICMGLVGAFLSMFYLNDYTSIFSSYDGLSFSRTQQMFALLAIGLTTLSVLLGYVFYKEDKEHTADYYGLILFSLTGALCLIGFNNLFMFFLGLEILSIPIYVLVGIQKGNSLASEASVKYFFTGSFATAIMLFGIALIYGATGSFNMNEIHMAVNMGLNQSPMLTIGVIMMMAAFLFKVGAVPFHFWGPDVYQGSSNAVMAYMASVVKLAALFAFVHLFNFTFETMIPFMSGLILFAIVVSLFLGYISALKQTSFRRMMAYSSIANTGFALFAVLNEQLGEASLWVIMIGYACSTISLVTINMIVEKETDDLTNWKGIGYANPLIGITLVISLLSMSGIPPFTGFFGKYLLLSGAFANYLPYVILAIIASLIGAYLYLRLMVLSLSKEGEGKKLNITPIQVLVLVLSLVGTLGGWLVLLIK